MSGQHRTDPRAWENVGVEYLRGSSAAACILELRARVEALEARRPTVQELCQRVEALESPSEHTAPTTEARPGGLVERVGNRLPLLPDGRVDGKAACAAIREVAQTLRASFFDHAADWLEQEADR